MDVSSLAFRELMYRQILPPAKWLTVKLLRSPRSNKLVVTNNSPYDLTQLYAIVAGQTFSLGPDLGRGQTTSREVPDVIHPDIANSPGSPQYTGPQMSAGYADLSDMAYQTKSIVVKATVAKPPVGPGLGDVVQDRQNVMVAFFTGLHYGKVSL
jgi:hypothetical protein